MASLATSETNIVSVTTVEKLGENDTIDDIGHIITSELNNTPKSKSKPTHASTEALSPKSLHKKSLENIFSYGGNVDDASKMMTKLITEGIKVLKFPRRGKPGMRILSVNPTLTWLCWAKPGRKDDVKKEKIDDIIEIRKGARTKVFRRHIDRKDPNLLKANENATCLSVIFETRTLDLQVESIEERNSFAYALSDLIGDDAKRETR